MCILREELALLLVSYQFTSCLLFVKAIILVLWVRCFSLLLEVNHVFCLSFELEIMQVSIECYFF
jgi:hypothetical protein